MDEGYDDELSEMDMDELRPIFNIMYEYFTDTGSRQSFHAFFEAMMDGLGYVYFIRRHWLKSSLLASIDEELRSAVTATTAGDVVNQFYSVAELPLRNSLSRFVAEKLNMATRQRRDQMRL